jgi:NADPH2:quinone reductase
VIEAGEGVADLRDGDRVGWQGVPGGYAELALVPAAVAVPLPEHVTEEQAAAVLLQGLSAHQLAGLAAHAPDGHAPPWSTPPPAASACCSPRSSGCAGTG